VFFYGADTRTPATKITDPISPGTGVLVYVFEDDDPAQEGITGGFPKTINVSGAENSADITPAINENDNGTNEGFTLLGNPFNTAIDFNELDKPDIEDAIYIWDVNDETGIEGGNSGAGSWKTYALGAGDITDGVIAPFQGFFVQNSGSSTGSVSFTEGSKTVGGEFYGKQVVKHLVRLELSGEGMSNSAWLRFSDQGSFDKTNGDALQLNPLSNNYALMAARKSDDVLVDIGHVPYPTEDFLLPIEIEVTKSGFYSISVTDLNLADGTDLYFEDRQKNISLLLDDAFTYSFELESMAKVNPNPLARIKEGNMLAKTTTTGRFVITANTSVSNEDETSAPTAFSLHQNYPNPFNPTTNIKYSIAQSGGVSLTIYNVMGQKVAMLVNEVKSAGNYQVNWDAANMASGVYYYRLQSAGQIKTRQMTLIK
ncbi:MAG: T9SS type A sorting domain-containing protein, partial [Balneolaceae bacterium]